MTNKKNFKQQIEVVYYSHPLHTYSALSLSLVCQVDSLSEYELMTVSRAGFLFLLVVNNCEHKM